MSTSDTDDDPVKFDLEIKADRTILTVEGQRDATIIVRSEGGERIYLPPENFDDEGQTTPYSTTPYSKSTESDDGTVTTPYSTGGSEASAEGDDVDYGRKPTPVGTRIIHPEPVTDVRFVR